MEPYPLDRCAVCKQEDDHPKIHEVFGMNDFKSSHYDCASDELLTETILQYLGTPSHEWLAAILNLIDEGFRGQDIIDRLPPSPYDSVD